MSARDEIREQIRTRLVGYVDTSDAEAVRLLDAFAAEVLREAAGAVEANSSPKAEPYYQQGYTDARSDAARRLRAMAYRAETGGA